MTDSFHSARRKRCRRWDLLALTLPLMLIVFLFSYVPLIGWLLSLVEYRPGYPLFANKFVGLKYFKLLFSSRDIGNALKNTVIFQALNFCLLPMPMLFAILLNEVDVSPFRKLVQTVTTLPHFISWVIVYSLAFALFSTDGMLNQVSDMLGLKKQSVLTDRNAVYWFQTLISQWKGLGWSSIIYIAAIAGIDSELYEAGVIDGAGRFRLVRHITIPGLMPTFTVLMLLAVSGFINSGMDQYYVFKNSIVYKRIEVLDLYTYRLGLQLGDYSFSTAVGILKSFISISLLTIANAVARKVRGSSIL
ncbi:MAG: ABC transporter permease subunit [Christensenellales bacterium]|jgi:putative aldouronate transport system permease protein